MSFEHDANEMQSNGISVTQPNLFKFGFVGHIKEFLQILVQEKNICFAGEN
jgi:hypothetical protein